MAKKITIDELFGKLSDLSIPEEDLRAYFQTDMAADRPFSPELKVDTRAVDVPSTADGRNRSAALLNSVNWAARMRRRAAFNKKIGSGTYKGPVIVSEGDSWFQYPILLTDVIDHLSRDFAILSLGAAGDTMSNMIKKAEYMKAISQTNAAVFLLSAGGNDLVADGNLARHLLKYDPSLSPVDHLKSSFNTLVSTVVGNYDTIFRQVTGKFPKLHILCHGYDYAIPDKGKWLGKPMISQKIKDPHVQRAIAREMMERFNAALSSLASTYGNVHYVDNRGKVGDTRWHDELHPKDAGFGDVANGYKKLITALTKPRSRGAPAVRSAPARKGRSLHVGLNLVDPAHYSGWDGALDACEFDAEDMTAIADGLGYTSKTILTKAAKRETILGEIDRAAKDSKPGDIFFLSYAGHGGQLPDFNGDEEGDFTDETWCLYDSQVIDDEFAVKWAKFQPGVRILVVADCCHSGTLIRSRADARDTGSAGEGARQAKTRQMPVVIASRTARSNKPYYRNISNDLGAIDESLLTRELNNPIACSVRLISGCQDNQVAMDGLGNGAFTAALLATWDEGRFAGNYQRFHREIVARMLPSQTPNHYQIGAANPVFDGQSPFAI